MMDGYKNSFVIGLLIHALEITDYFVTYTDYVTSVGYGLKVSNSRHICNCLLVKQYFIQAYTLYEYLSFT
jgi:hypothetical protein